MAMLVGPPAQAGTVKVSYPSYSGTNEIEVNIEELNALTPVKTGCVYPNLESQVSYARKGIERRKASILETIAKVAGFTADDVVPDLLDSIYNYIQSEYEASKESGLDGLDINGLRDVVGIIYGKIEFIKQIRELQRDFAYLMEDVNKIKLAQKGVLL